MDGITVIVNTAVIVPINVLPLIDDTDFKSIEASVVYNAAGLALLWNFVTAAGVQTQTAVTPTNTGGVYDWQNKGNGMYAIEIPASAGGTINNDTAGFGWFSGVATGVLPWRGPVIQFSPANVVNSLVVGSDLIDTSLVQYNGSAIGGTAAQIAAGIAKWFDVAGPTGTLLSIPDALPDAAGGLVIKSSVATVADIWAELTSALNVSGSIGKLLVDNLLHPQLATTIATLTSQTNFTLNAGTPADDAFNGRIICIISASVNTLRAYSIVDDWTLSTKQILLKYNPNVFAMQVNDLVVIL